MLSNNEMEEESSAQDVVYLGHFAADTQDDVLRFLSAVARLAGDDGSQHTGFIHILSLHAKVAFQLSLTGKNSTTQDVLGKIWYGMEDISKLDIQGLVVEDDLAMDNGHRQAYVLLTLRFIGHSAAIVVLPDE